MKPLFTLLLLTLGVTIITAQKTWTLEDCIDYALENSLTILESEVNLQASDADFVASKLNRLPNISGNTSYSISFGRRIDPTTNDFINQQFGNQSFSVNGGITLFQGGFIRNQIKSAGNIYEASRLDKLQTESDIVLNITRDYLSVLFALDNLEVAKTNLAITQEQIDQTQKMIDIGTRAKNEVLEFLAQAATNEENIILAENQVDNAILTLKHRMNLTDSQEEFQVIVPDLTTDSQQRLEMPDENALFNQAVDWFPMIKSSQLNVSNAEIGVSLSRANFLPDLSFGAGLGSNYSSVAPFDYLDQIKENFGYGFSLNLGIPIFTQGRNKNNFQRAKLDVTRAQVQYQQIENNVQLETQRALADAKAARKSYDASVKTYEARLAAFQDTEKRFQYGVASTFELTTAQNNLESAEINKNAAFYDMLIKEKIIEYYQGKKLEFK